MFVYQTKIKLHDTDAASILFFSHQFEIMHDAYEALLEKIGLGFAELLRNRDYFLPIVHAEADYKMPLFVGDVVEIQVVVENVGNTSFAFVYKIFNARQELVGTGRTVHVTIDKKTRRKIDLPKEMRDKISMLYNEDQLLKN